MRHDTTRKILCKVYYSMVLDSNGKRQYQEGRMERKAVRGKSLGKQSRNAFERGNGPREAGWKPDSKRTPEL